MSRPRHGAGPAAKSPSEDWHPEPVHLRTLRVRRAYDFDLYLKTEGGFSLYRAKHTRFSERDRQRLLENDVEILYVPGADRGAYRDYLLNELEGLVSDPEISLAQRCAFASQGGRGVAHDLFEQPGQLRLYADGDRLVRSMITLILGEPKASDGLARMLRHDYYTYTHAINVSTLAILLAIQLGIDDREQLRQIGLGGLLHDIGKTRISQALINKREPLSDREINELRRHPDYGMLILMETEPAHLSREALLMVHEHHERFDGSGYPVGLRGSELSVCGQLCAVVDIYDAMTCQRSYRDALDMTEALAFLEGESGRTLNRWIVETWIETAPRLVQGSRRLSEDAQAVAQVAVTSDEFPPDTDSRR